MTASIDHVMVLNRTMRHVIFQWQLVLNACFDDDGAGGGGGGGGGEGGDNSIIVLNIDDELSAS